MSDDIMMRITAKMKVVDHVFDMIKDSGTIINSHIEKGEATIATKQQVVIIINCSARIKKLLEDSEKLLNDNAERLVGSESYKTAVELVESYKQTLFIWENFAQFVSMQIVMIDVNKAALENEGANDEK